MKKNSSLQQLKFSHIVKYCHLTWVSVIFIIVLNKSKLQSCAVCLFVIFFFQRWTFHVHILNRLIIKVHVDHKYMILIFDESNLHLHKTHWFLLDLIIFWKMFLSASPVRQTGIRCSTFESLCLGRSSQRIASGFLASGIPWCSRKTESLWESRFSFLMKVS